MTQTYYSHKDSNLLSETLNSEMLKLARWCRGIKLSINSWIILSMINLIEASYMVSRPLQRRQTLDLSMKFKIDNNNIECLKETVF